LRGRLVSLPPMAGSMPVGAIGHSMVCPMAPTGAQEPPQSQGPRDGCGSWGPWDWEGYVGAWAGVAPVTGVAGRAAAWGAGPNFVQCLPKSGPSPAVAGVDVTPGAGHHAWPRRPPVRWRHRPGYHRYVGAIDPVGTQGLGATGFSEPARHRRPVGRAAHRSGGGWPIPSPSSRRPDQRAERDGSSGNDLPPLEATREVCSADGPGDGTRDGARPKGPLHPGAGSAPAGGRPPPP
jgi:hypothetical protein